MPIVLAPLLPTFLLIVLGAILKHTLMRLETQWHGLERLTYYVLLPMLLIQTLVKADLGKVARRRRRRRAAPLGSCDVAAVSGVAAPARAASCTRPIPRHSSNHQGRDRGDPRRISEAFPCNVRPPREKTKKPPNGGSSIAL